MRLTRVHVVGPLQADSELLLPANGAYHVVTVLRARVGTTLIVFDGADNEHRAEIIAIDGDEVRVRIGARILDTTESNLHITLVQGISRSERMDWTLQKATELGVTAIAPVFTSRSVVRLDDRQARNKLEHWQAVIVGACAQSGRRVVPPVHTPQRLRDYLSQPPIEGLRLVLSPNASIALTGLDKPPHNIELLIGPEGGLDADELQLAERSGFMPVRLGPRVLRTETASVVALSVLQALWGDLQ